MLGAMIGDIAGSRFEFNNIKTKTFTLLTPECFPTDDSVMTLAVAQAILDCDGAIAALPEKTVQRMQELGHEYPLAGYGAMFTAWLQQDDPQPYQSFGNGAAMRIAPCGYAADTLERVQAIARTVTAVTHDHEESYKAAEAIAGAVFLARNGATMQELKEYVEQYYTLDFTLDEIREEYSFNETCMESVPQALEAFFESTSFVDAIRNAISIGGDSDTVACITGAVAGAYYSIPAEVAKQALKLMDKRQRAILRAFAKHYDITDGHMARKNGGRKYRVITLCGSTRFKDEFMEAQKKLTLEGNIVISVGLFGHSGDGEVWTEGVKEMLDDMHKRKIDMADEIFVINVGGYIGESTRSEIEYAENNGKPVRYLEPVE